MPCRYATVPRELPGHGHHVRAWIELIDRSPFHYWRVVKIVPWDQALGEAPPPSNPTPRHKPVADQRMLAVEGYVCLTSQHGDPFR